MEHSVFYYTVKKSLNFHPQAQHQGVSTRNAVTEQQSQASHEHVGGGEGKRECATRHNPDEQERTQSKAELTMSRPN